ncbi:MAG TPA: DUF5320 domain-containing protein [Bacteroidales bacterium]|nr:DUF5320 domain-containing protein [Bacteroidales bacterium]
MPRMNGTGPEGKGPRTGRGLGRCRKGKNFDPESLQPGSGRNAGRGQGARRGKGRGKNPGEGQKQ